MKIIRKNKTKIKKKNLLEHKPKFEKRWKTRPHKFFSNYPYLMTVTQFRRNIFLTITDFHGRIKVWTNIGSSGYKNKEKINYLAVFPVVKEFLKVVEKRRLFIFFLIFRNIRRWRGARAAFRHVFHQYLLTKKKKEFRLLGCWTELFISFNGCRLKKKRRKRKKRKSKRLLSGFNYKIKKKFTKKVNEKNID